jgi:hypothetical protein
MRSALRAIPVVLVSVSLTLALWPRGAHTTPTYAARNGLMCVTCHFDPNGGGPRNEFGFAFAKNRHSLEAETDTTSMWKDLNLTNRIGDNMPVYIGLNQRFMLLTSELTTSDGVDQAAFFNMENGIHLAFQPHPRLTAVYTFDAFATGPTSTVRSKEAFAMIGGFPWDGYIKGGRFRVPFGLRMDDHTVATRAGFESNVPAAFGSFLPYDPRYPDMGVEFGMSHGGLFGRVSLTNGEAAPLADGHAEAKAAKIGYNMHYYQGGISFYDDIVKTGTDPIARHTRWGYYGMTHYKTLAFVGEVAAGTDDDKIAITKTNRFAAFGEADYAPWRWANFRARLDRLELNRDPDPLIRQFNTLNRYSIEGEFVPVPFAELRWSYRYIDAKDPTVADDRQAFLQLHVSY